MIKSLFGENADQSDQNKTEDSNVTISRSTSESNSAPQYIEVNEAEDLLDNSETLAALEELENSELNDEESFQPSDEKMNETFDAAETRFDLATKPINEISAEETENFNESNSNTGEMPSLENEESINDFVLPSDSINQTSTGVTAPFENIFQEAERENSKQIEQSNIEPQSLAETARQSGLAYAAAITLFASVVFMLIIGWFADLLFGSSPWGKVGGIVLGSLIGFIQLFRITSQIFKNRN